MVRRDKVEIAAGIAIVEQHATARKRLATIDVRYQRGRATELYPLGRVATDIVLAAARIAHVVRDQSSVGCGGVFEKL